jgi:hypothetical protein
MTCESPGCPIRLRWDQIQRLELEAGPPNDYRIDADRLPRRIGAPAMPIMDRAAVDYHSLWAALTPLSPNFSDLPLSSAVALCCHRPNALEND